jgi:hypothetical protein
MLKFDFQLDTSNFPLHHLLQKDEYFPKDETGHSMNLSSP